MVRRQTVTLHFIFTFIFFTLAIYSRASGSDYKSHNVIYSESITYEIKEINKGEYRFSSITRVDMEFPEGLQSNDNYHTINPSNSEEIDKIKGEYRGTKLKKDDISSFLNDKESFLTGGRVYVLHFPGDMKKGDTLWYSYEQKKADMVFFPIHYVPNETLVKKYSVVIKHPSDLSVDFELFFPRDSIKCTIINPSPTLTTISFDSIPEAKELPYFPFNGYNASFITIISKEGLDITPISPLDFTGWYFGHLDTIPQLTDSLPAALRNLLNSSPNDIARLKIIYDYIQTNIRRVSDVRGLNAYVPHAPSFVLNNLYGDCKDRAFLCKSLAALYGIPVNLALISTEVMATFKSIHANLFNHVICLYEDSPGMIFFDPTIKYYSFGNLWGKLAGEKTFIIDSVRPRYETTATDLTLPTFEISITGSMSEPKNCSASVIFRGDYYAYVGEGWSASGSVERENFLSQALNKRIINIAIDNFQLINQNDIEISFTARADLSRFIINSGNKKYIPANIFTNLNGDLLERREDSYPLYFENPRNMSLILDLFADGYNITPDSVTLLCGDSISYTAQIESDSGVNGIITYNLSILPKIIGGRSKNEFIRFCEDYFKNKTKMFIMKEKGQ